MKRRKLPESWGGVVGGGPPGHPDDQGGEERAPWRDDLITTKSGWPTSALANAVLIVRHHPRYEKRLAFNIRSLQQTWVEPPPWGGATGPVASHHYTLLNLDIAKAERVNFSVETLQNAVEAVAHDSEYDPLIDWLDGIEWDGEERIDRWLTTYLGVQPGEYTDAVGRAWLISAIARCYEPGCQVDHILVVEGPQGARKSSALRVLAGDEWFSEMALIPTEKDGLIAVHGPWIIEWAELVGHGRAESEALKAFISRRVDRFRPPYGRVMGDFSRRCVFAGSTNDTEYIADPTGARRYWPVRAAEVCHIDVAALARDRVQLWAEAKAAYRRGDHWWLDDDTEAIACTEQADRQEGDPWDEAIQFSIESGTLRSAQKATAAELLEVVGVAQESRTKGHLGRLKSIMARLGWDRRRGGVFVRSGG